MYETVNRSIPTVTKIFIDVILYNHVLSPLITYTKYKYIN